MYLLFQRKLAEKNALLLRLTEVQQKQSQNFNALVYKDFFLNGNQVLFSLNSQWDFNAFVFELELQRNFFHHFIMKTLNQFIRLQSYGLSLFVGVNVEKRKPVLSIVRSFLRSAQYLALVLNETISHYK